MRANADRLLAVIALLTLWMVLHDVLGAEALASPLATLQRITDLLLGTRLWAHASVTLSVWLAAFAMAASVGVILGLLMGLYRGAGLVVEPFISALASLPKVTLYPMVLLIFGLGVSSKLVFGFLHGVLPVVLFTLGAVRQIPLIQMKSARAMGLSHAACLRHVMLPSIWPSVLSGLKLGASLTLLGMLIGEMFGAQKGLGFLLMNAMELNDTASLSALSVLLLVVALGLNAVFSRMTMPR
ncbi:MAG: ABC transporter permease [Oxalobacteraceae bacterium]